MSPRLPALRSDGFSFIEIMIAIGLTMGLAMLTSSLLDNQLQSASQAQTSATKDRIVAGVRSLAGNPAALRNSMQAADGVAAVNPQLLSCAGGNPANACVGAKSIPLTLYSPVVNVDTDGTILGLQVIASPTGSSTPMRFDIGGSPCLAAQVNCPLLVSTSFVARCGPPHLTSAQLAGPLTAAQLQPQPKCTVADTIEVVYVVQLDPLMAAANPQLVNLSAPITGSVATPVALISGNQPQ